MAQTNKPMSRTANAERLRKAKDAYVNPNAFNVGDMVILNPILIPDGITESHMSRGIYMPLIVIDTVACYSDLAAEDRGGPFYPGQWFRSAEVSTDDSVAMQWCPAWMYVLAPPEMLADVASTANH